MCRQVLGLPDEESADVQDRKRTDVENLVAPRIKENPPKRDSYRTIPVNNECVAFLDSHPHNEYLFPNPDSSPQSPNSRSHKHKRFMREMHAKDLSIPILSPHLASDGA